MSRKRKAAAAPDHEAGALAAIGLMVADNHPDAELIRLIERVETLREFIDRHPDRFKDKEILGQLRAHMSEWVKVGDKIAGTPARTRLGLHAKAMLALREADPKKPCGGDWNMLRLADSVLFDAWQIGALATGGIE